MKRSGSSKQKSLLDPLPERCGNTAPPLRLRCLRSCRAQSRFIVQWRVRVSSALWSAFARPADVQPHIGLICQILAETHKKIRHASTALFPRVPRGGIDSRSQPGQPERTILPLDATLDAFWCPQSHITHSISKHTQHQSRAIARFKDRIVQKDN